MKKAPIVGLLFVVIVIASIAAVPRDEDSIQPRRDVMASPAWPGFTRTAPIVVASDADFPLQGFTGTGTSADPWVLDGVLIECNGSGTAISISGTSEHYVIKNSFLNESGATPLAEFMIYLAAAPNGVIQNVTMEDAGSICVAVLSSNVTVINCTINRVPTAYGLYFGNGNNLDVINCTFIENNSTAIMINDGIGAPVNARIENCTIEGNTTSTAISTDGLVNGTIVGNWIGNSSYSCDLTDTINVTIEGNTFVRNYYNDVKLSTCANISIRDNVFTACSNPGQHHIAGTVNDGIRVVNNSIDDRNGFADIAADNVVFDGNVHRYAGTSAVHGVFITANENVTFINNVLNSQYSAAGYAFEVAHGGAGDCDILVQNNTFDSTGPSTLSTTGMVGVEQSRNATIRDNHFVNVTRNIFVVHTTATNLTVTNNTFDSIAKWVNPATGLANFTWDSNYYRQYFNTYPYAVTSNTTTDVLEYTWNMPCQYPGNTTAPFSINDTHPLYLRSWYPRSQVVNIRAYSSVDGQGIPFENLKIYVDGVQIATSSPVITAVLFRLTIQDFKGRLLHDQVYNLNATSTNLNIPVDVAVQIFFHFYSTIDHFGLDFSLVKLYIDGTRYTRLDPIMELRVITVTIRDFADTVLYNQALNLSVTGCFLDIGLDIAPIIVKNNFDFTATFELTRGGTSIRYTMPAQSEILLRLALGTYTYSVFYQNGTEYISRSITFSASGAVSFGWTTIPAGTINNDYASPLLDLAIIGLFIGLAFGGIIIVRARIPTQTTTVRKKYKMRDK